MPKEQIFCIFCKYCTVARILGSGVFSPTHHRYIAYLQCSSEFTLTRPFHRDIFSELKRPFIPTKQPVKFFLRRKAFSVW